MQQELDDISLLSLMQTDPERGFRRLMSQYQERLYWHIRRILVNHDDAEDALQETFIRAYRKIGQFGGQSRLSTWLMRIATNEALRILERRPQPMVSLDDVERPRQVADGDSGSGGALLSVEGGIADLGDRAALLLQQAILSLPTKQQLAFNMRYYDEMAFADIAEAIGSTPASVKQLYHLAKERIRARTLQAEALQAPLRSAQRNACQSKKGGCS